MEDALVSYRNTWVILQFLFLKFGQASTNFYDVIPRPFVHPGPEVANVVEDVQSKRSVPSSNLVNDEVFVGIVLEEIFCYNALCNALSVPWLRTGVRIRVTADKNHRVP